MNNLCYPSQSGFRATQDPILKSMMMWVIHSDTGLAETEWRVTGAIPHADELS